MPGVARITDLFAGVCVCCSYSPAMGGTIITGSGNVQTNELGTVRIGDIVLGYCGHTGVIVGGSGTVTVNGIGIARLGDAVAGCLIGTIVSSSGNVTADS